MSLIVVYGATGWTGRQVVRTLVARGLRVALAGRSPDRLERLAAAVPGVAEVRPASLREPRAVIAALRDASVVVHCAGPFLQTGALMIDAALQAGAHYLDVSGEGSYVADVHRRFHRAAMDRQLVVCPGFAAKGALGDWAAQLAFVRAGPPVDEVAIGYAHGLREYLRPSIGSALASAGQSFFRGAGTWSSSPPPRVFSFPPPFGAGLSLPVTSAEDCSIPKHVPARAVTTFLSVDPGGPANEPWARLSLAALPILPWVGQVMSSTWGRYHLHLFAPKPEARHARDSFGLTVELTSGARMVQRLGVIAYDAYASTAEIIALGALRLSCASTPLTIAGVRAPAELCDAATALELLEQRGAAKLFLDRSLRDDRSR